MNPTRPANRYLLLAGFVLLSALLHAALLLIEPSTRARDITPVAMSAPLQVVVVSSRKGNKPDRPAGRPAATIREKTTVPELPVNPTRPVLASGVKVKPPVHDKTTTETVTQAQPRHEATVTGHTATPGQTGMAMAKNIDEADDANPMPRPAPVNHLRSRLHSELARHFIYPRLARRMGWEGQVGLKLHIDGDGSLEDVRVVRSSGYKVLDENARSTLNRIGRITVAGNMYIEPVDTEIEVLYRLTN